MHFGARSRRLSGHITIALPICILVLNGCRSARDYAEKGNALFDRGDYAAASLNYRKALQKDPKYGEAYHWLGLAQWKLGNPSDAFQSLSLALQFLPQSETARIDLANFALEAYLQDPQRPKILYDRITSLSDELVKRNPNAFDGLRIKGYVALLDHKPQEAFEFLRRADQSKPGQEEVLVGMMEALYQSRQVAEAEKLGLDSIAADKTGRIYDALVRLYSGANRPTEVEKVLIRKIKDHPKEARYALELAGYYARAKKTEQMTAALQPLLSDSATFPHGHLSAGEFYIARGDGPKAVEQFKVGAAAHPNDVRYQQRIAQVLVFQNKRDEALKVLDAVVKTSPMDKRVRMLRAALLVDNPQPGKPDEGLGEFQALLNQDPYDVLLRFLFAKAQLQRGNLGAARAQLIEVTRRNPAFLEAHLLSAQIALQEGQLNQAIQHAAAALRMDENNLRAQFMQGSALLGLGNLDQASVVFHALLRQAPDSVDARLQLAFLEKKRKNFAAAEAAYKKIFEADPQEWRALAGLVQTYSDQKQLDRALALLQAGLQRNPGSSEVRSMLADTAASAGKYDLAIEQYRQLAAASPHSIDPQIQLADVLRRKGDLNSAITTLQNAAAMQPTDTRPPYLLAALLDQVNRKDEAKAQCRRALSLRPDDVVLMNNLAALLAETGDNLDEALKLARQAVDKAPGNPEFSDTLGWVYLKKGMSENSVEILRKLVHQHSNNAVFSFHLGMALYARGDLAEARLQLARALELEPSGELREQIHQALQQSN